MNPLISLQDRTVIVTGAAQGIGKSIVELAVQLGANVIAVDLKAEALAELAAAHPEGRVTAAVGSVCDAEFAALTVEQGVQRYGAIHGLVNNAGITRPAMIEKMTAKEWQDVIDVHLTGTFHWMQSVGRHMVEQAKAGVATDRSIVNISSDAGRKGAIGQINYAAAKAGMLGMTMTAAREWGRHGIRTNSVCFGVVETPMTEVIRGEKFRDKILAQIPLERWASSDEVVKSICFLLSDASSYVTGQHLGVNGGFHISL